MSFVGDWSKEPTKKEITGWDGHVVLTFATISSSSPRRNPMGIRRGKSHSFLFRRATLAGHPWNRDKLDPSGPSGREIPIAHAIPKQQTVVQNPE